MFSIQAEDPDQLVFQARNGDQRAIAELLDLYRNFLLTPMEATQLPLPDEKVIAVRVPIPIDVAFAERRFDIATVCRPRG